MITSIYQYILTHHYVVTYFNIINKTVSTNFENYKVAAVQEIEELKTSLACLASQVHGWTTSRAENSVGSEDPQLFQPAFSSIDRGIVLSVHGDDFTAAGPKDSLDWYQNSSVQNQIDSLDRNRMIDLFEMNQKDDYALDRNQMRD